MPKIVIPRLRRLRVEGYELYPPHPVHGVFDHEFQPGVNVIVGINGLGKTTLLNLIFRMLVGPYDPSKADRIRPGRKQAFIKRTTNFDFFRKRTVDQAVSAVATAVFAFGDDEVKVTRSLRDLCLLRYEFQGESHEATRQAQDLDNQLMDLLCRLAGLDPEPDPNLETDPDSLPAYRYDFDFLVRNLVFFLEDKVPLIWNADGQFVILRILMVNKALSREIAAARNELLRADSIYRNRVWARNALEEDIRVRSAELSDAGIAVERLDLLASELQAVSTQRNDLEARRLSVEQEIEAVDADLLDTRAALFDAEVVVRNEEGAYFQSAFSKTRPPGDLVVQAIASHQGCLVCGNDDKVTYERARARLARRCCPVCESEVESLDGTVDLGETRRGRLVDAERRVAALQDRFERVSRAADQARHDYEQVLDDLMACRRHQLNVRAKLEAAQGAELGHAELRELSERLAAMDREVRDLDVKLEVAQQRHEELIVRSRTDIERYSEAIVQAFDRYAKDFMVDDCRLRYRADRRGKVGQGDRLIDWPAFEVDLSSGEGNRLTGRSDGSEVSESQKEFIDLAFRMALLRVATEDSPSMLVMETPEASLDAIFMARAGSLLREYGGDNAENVLLVSSNLTGESMIPELLGVGQPDEENYAARMKRVVNLLERARPTKALQGNRAEYEREFAKAVGPKDVPATAADDDGDDGEVFSSSLFPRGSSSDGSSGAAM